MSRSKGKNTKSESKSESKKPVAETPSAAKSTATVAAPSTSAAPAFDSELDALFAKSAKPVEQPAAATVSTTVSTAAPASSAVEASNKKKPAPKRKSTEDSSADKTEADANVTTPKANNKKKRKTEAVEETTKDAATTATTATTADVTAVTDDGTEKMEIVGNEDEEESDDGDDEDSKKTKSSKKADSKDDAERLTRTCFVGNLPVSVLTDKSQQASFKDFFRTKGTIETYRFRSLMLSRIGMRAALAKKKDINSRATVCNAFVVYSTKESVQDAVRDLNGQVFLEHHLRVDFAAPPTTARTPAGGAESDANAVGNKVNRRTSVFVGNLPFDSCEEDLYKFFGQCGKVTNVRVVRDSTTNVGKGFAFVQFDSRACVPLAMKLNDSNFVSAATVAATAKGKTPAGRKLRITKVNKEGEDDKNEFFKLKEQPLTGAARRLARRQNVTGKPGGKLGGKAAGMKMKKAKKPRKPKA
ncbi:hypothetical protein GQ42DRAFT_162810 [Ramicandelaber brevisporus]|nr:hypothetical protein GQ42DRAFT_162810 [Ramicandelaber brevisporus]